MNIPRCRPNRSSFQLVGQLDLLLQTVLSEGLDLDRLHSSQIVRCGIAFQGSRPSIDEVARVDERHLGQLSHHPVSGYAGAAALLGLKLCDAVLDTNIR